jgi:hypothetical protein
MKTLIALFLTFLPLSALAATVDTFECTLEVDNLLTQEKTTETHMMDIARRPQAMTGAPTDESTTTSMGQGSLTVTVGGNNVTVYPRIQYTIALKTDGGEQFEARQLNCNGVGASVCALNVPAGQCFAVGSTCPIGYLDPFDPASGWSSIPVVAGIPAYDSQELIDATGTLVDPKSDSPLVTYRSSCQYKGTMD